MYICICTYIHAYIHLYILTIHTCRSSKRRRSLPSVFSSIRGTTVLPTARGMMHAWVSDRPL